MNNTFVHLAIALYFLASLSCKNADNTTSLDLWKSEIRAAEESFAKLALSEGMGKAFLTYAAPDAVLMRNNSIIKGVDEIQKYFSNQQPAGNATLTWSPDFVDVSSSGDLGYTYGQYKYQGIDSTGQIFESNGIFHTVWKRQPDGRWRFVWD